MEKLGSEHPSLECWDGKPGAFLEGFTLAPPKALLSTGSGSGMGAGAGAPTGRCVALVTLSVGVVVGRRPF